MPSKCYFSLVSEYRQRNVWCLLCTFKHPNKKKIPKYPNHGSDGEKGHSQARSTCFKVTLGCISVCIAVYHRRISKHLNHLVSRDFNIFLKPNTKKSFLYCKKESVLITKVMSANLKLINCNFSFITSRWVQPDYNLRYFVNF